MFSFPSIAVSLLLLVCPAIKAQSQTFDTPIPCCSVPANQVPQSQRIDWCTVNLNTCVDLCGGQGQIASAGNTCDTTTLNYTCKCSNGTNISNDIMKQYQLSVPGQMCQFWFGACINATNSNAAAQFQCENARNSQCGNLTTNRAASSSSGFDPARATATPNQSPSATSSRALSSTISSSSVAISSSTATTGGPLINGIESKKSKVSAGTIAGAVVGGLAGLAILIALIWLCIRRRKKSEAQTQATLTRHGAYDEKQVQDPSDMPMPMKPELHGTSAVNELGAETAATRYEPAELHSSPREAYASPYTQENQYEGARQPYITDWQNPHEMQANAPPYTPAPVETYQHQTEAQPPQQQQQTPHQQLSEVLHPPPSQGPQEMLPKSPAPEHATLQRQLSVEEIASLEEEERRIDAEMEEFKRMKELRDQKAAIQQRLKDAKR